MRDFAACAANRDYRGPINDSCRVMYQELVWVKLIQAFEL